MIEYLIFCVVAFAVTFGMYFMREYLRSRGYGPQLDAVARWLEPRERRMNRYRLKAANGLLGGGAVHESPAAVRKQAPRGDDRTTAHGHHVRASL